MSHTNCKRPDSNIGCIDCVAYGAAEEQERIIKLLEDPMWHHLAYVPRFIGEELTIHHDGECLGCKQIALIKGENK